jgi:hypothetical protein
MLKHKFLSERILFLATIIVVIGFLCVPDFPPMVDMPQHAAQVSALGELVRGDFLWNDLIEINYFTPYWIGYGSWLLLALLFPITVATKIILCITFLLFVLSFSFLRQKFGAPGSLDWLLIPAFFGFSYEWGFLTFMLSTSIGCMFYYATIKMMENTKIYRSLIVLFWGIILAFSHLLMFIFFGLVATVHIFTSGKISRIKEALILLWPYVFLGFLAGSFVFLKEDALSSLYYPGDITFIWGSLGDRIRFFLTTIIPSGFSIVNRSLLLISVLAIPFLLGYRFTKKSTSFSMMTAFVIAWLFFPHFAGKVFFIYQRFSLLFIPAYILCFEKKETLVKIKFSRLFLGLVMVVLMYFPLANHYFFKEEAREFSALLDDLPKGKKALFLTFDRDSKVVTVPSIFLHFPLWYQAKNAGWVDFNFAWFYPQVIKYRPEKAPKDMPPGYEWTPDVVLSSLQECDRYDLIFIRIDAPLDADSLKQTACPSHLLYKSRGEWYVFRRERNS